MPNITAVNALGDFAISADRLAIIDGEGELSLLCYSLRHDMLILVSSRPLEALYAPQRLRS